MTFNKLPGAVPRLAIKIALDTSVFLVAFILSYLLRFNIEDFARNLTPMLPSLPLIVIARLSSFALFKVYASMWRYSSTHDLLQIIKATTLSTVLIISAFAILGHKTLPRSIIATDWLLVIFFTGGLRLAIRKLHSVDLRSLRHKRSFSRVLIFGAGRAGEFLLRNIENTHEVKVNL